MAQAKGTETGRRSTAVCAVCGKRLLLRATDRYADGHARCWAVWRANGRDMTRARAILAKAGKGT